MKKATETQKNQKLGDLGVHKPIEILSSFVESRAASPLWHVGLKHNQQSIRKNGVASK
jgi:hypothetical protein